MELQAERSTPGFAKKWDTDARRREKRQAAYIEDCHGLVLAVLAFHPAHIELADRLARAVTNLTTPIGSGTVARIQRIPIEHRADVPIIAWLRHRTTGYRGMALRRVRGKRREVQSMLARRSQLRAETTTLSYRLWKQCPDAFFA